VVVRDSAAQRAAFARAAPYLDRAASGLAGGGTWPVDLGPELSRGFRALKVWLALRVFGTERLGQMVERCCDLARRLGERIAAEPLLELLAPGMLNVVCFRHRRLDDAGQMVLAAELQEAGGPVLSTTRVDGRVALRACVANHRTGESDVEAVLVSVLAAGIRIAATIRKPAA
jgi:glutamate/tyrosine decarboxylase-like PLP-dependent enzyme